NLAANETSPRMGFTRPELFAKVRCRNHPWEEAWISSFDHPFFAVTDVNGKFVISNVPPGNYVLHAAHVKATDTNAVKRAVSVVAGKRFETTIVIDLPGAGPVSQLDRR